MRGHTGKRQLSTVELLPREADATVAEAVAAYRERRLSQTAITAQLNQRLAALGVDQRISSSALNRFLTGLDDVPSRFSTQKPAAAPSIPSDLRDAIVALIDERIRAVL